MASGRVGKEEDLLIYVKNTSTENKKGAKMSSQEISIYLAKFRFNLLKAHSRNENGGEGS